MRNHALPVDTHGGDKEEKNFGREKFGNTALSSSVCFDGLVKIGNIGKSSRFNVRAHVRRAINPPANLREKNSFDPR